jgi:hypothetical protein
MKEGRNAGITDERELFSYISRKIEEAPAHRRVLSGTIDAEHQGRACRPHRRRIDDLMLWASRERQRAYDAILRRITPN